MTSDECGERRAGDPLSLRFRLRLRYDATRWRDKLTRPTFPLGDMSPSPKALAVARLAICQRTPNSIVKEPGTVIKNTVAIRQKYEAVFSGSGVVSAQSQVALDMLLRRSLARTPKNLAPN